MATVKWRRSPEKWRPQTMTFRLLGCRQRGLTIIAITLVAFVVHVSCFITKTSVLRDAKPANRRGILKQGANVYLRRNLSTSSREYEKNATNLYNRYMNLLDTCPLLTKSISSGIVSVLGDALAQWIEATKAQLPFILNWTRLLSFFVCNTFFVGPFLHLWWNQVSKFGNWLETRYQCSKRVQILAQVLVDQTVGVAVFFPTYFYAFELAEGLVSLKGEFCQLLSCRKIDGPNHHSLTFLSLSPAATIVPLLANASTKCTQELMPVLLMQYRVWPLVTFIIFAYVPESLRVLAGNVVAVIWNAWLCTRVA